MWKNATDLILFFCKVGFIVWVSQIFEWAKRDLFCCGLLPSGATFRLPYQQEVNYLLANRFQLDVSWSELKSINV